MVLYTGFIGPAAMLGSSRRRKVPFHVGGSGGERDVVEVAYLRFISCKLPKKV